MSYRPTLLSVTEDMTDEYALQMHCSSAVVCSAVTNMERANSTFSKRSHRRVCAISPCDICVRTSAKWNLAIWKDANVSGA